MSFQFPESFTWKCSAGIFRSCTRESCIATLVLPFPLCPSLSQKLKVKKVLFNRAGASCSSQRHWGQYGYTVRATMFLLQQPMKHEKTNSSGLVKKATRRMRCNRGGIIVDSRAKVAQLIETWPPQLQRSFRSWRHTCFCATSTCEDLKHFTKSEDTDNFHSKSCQGSVGANFGKKKYSFSIVRVLPLPWLFAIVQRVWLLKS